MGQRGVKTVEALKFCSLRKLTSLTYMVLWILAEDMRFLSQRQKPLITRGTSSNTSISISTSVPFSFQDPWGWCEAPRWLLLPQWVSVTAGNPELREPESLIMEQANLPALCSGGRHYFCHTGQVAHLPSALEGDTIFCKAARYLKIFENMT